MKQKASGRAAVRLFFLVFDDSGNIFRTSPWIWVKDHLCEQSVCDSVKIKHLPQIQQVFLNSQKYSVIKINKFIK